MQLNLIVWLVSASHADLISSTIRQWKTPTDIHFAVKGIGLVAMEKNLKKTRGRTVKISFRLTERVNMNERSEMNCISRLVSCPDCQGFGDVPCADINPIEEMQPCGLCNGYGEIEPASDGEGCKIQSANNEIAHGEQNGECYG
jgi:DnaJ-class molecular chaperone